MMIKIIMVNGERFDIEENIYTTLYGFIDHRLGGEYFFINDSYIDAIKTSNILRLQRTDGHTNDDTEEMSEYIKKELSNTDSTKSKNCECEAKLLCTKCGKTHLCLKWCDNYENSLECNALSTEGEQ